MTKPPLRPNQVRGLEGARHCVRKNINPSVIVGACGSGKSRIMAEIEEAVTGKGGKVVYLLHRKLLVKQIAQNYKDQGRYFSVVARDWEKFEDPQCSIQIVSVQTLVARRKKMQVHLSVRNQIKRGFLPDATYVLVDEAHCQGGETYKEVIDLYLAAGAKVFGFTATPTGIGHVYKEIIPAGSYSEMLSIKPTPAHLPIKCFSGVVYDPELFKPVTVSGLSEAEIARKFGLSDEGKSEESPKAKAIFGDVFKTWADLNPWQLPTILYAPGKPESIWFVKEFAKKGVRAAHIDATHLVFADPDENGNLQIVTTTRSEEAERKFFEGSKDGTYKVVCNRFVMREALDLVWMYHAILATAFGGVTSYLQSVGRVQRWFPGYDHVILQDHGCNVARHLPPDIDREWDLDDDDHSIAKKLQEEREKDEDGELEPIVCPKCKRERMSGSKCPECGHVHNRSERMVFQHKGDLVEVVRKKGRLVKYKAPPTFDKMMRSQIFASAYKNDRLHQAIAIAKSKAEKKGVELVVPEWVTRRGDDYDRPVREVFPWCDPGRRKKR